MFRNRFSNVKFLSNENDAGISPVSMLFDKSMESEEESVKGWESVKFLSKKLIPCGATEWIVARGDRFRRLYLLSRGNQVLGQSV